MRHGRRPWCSPSRLALLVAGAQLLAFLALLSRMPTLSQVPGSSALQGSSVSSLRRCLSPRGRDSRFALPGDCVTPQQRVATLSALLAELSAVFEVAEVGFWLHGAALMGQLRAESLVVWDAHAAVGITSKELEKLQRRRGGGLDAHVKAGFELDVVDSEVFSRGECGQAVQARLVDTKFGFYVDVFAFDEVEGSWKNGEEEVDGVKLLVSRPSELWSKCVHCRKLEGSGDAKRRRHATVKQLVVPHDWIMPLRSCSINGLQVLCPARTEQYLALEFGEGNF